MKNCGPESEKISLNHTNMRQARRIMGFQADSGKWMGRSYVYKVVKDVESSSASIQKSQAKVQNIAVHYIR